MTVVKNRPEDYQTRAKLGSRDSSSNKKPPERVPAEQLLRRVRCIDSAGYVHWNMATKKA